jgi:hypothetical protein
MDTKHYYFSDAKFLKLDIPVPHIEMLKEVQALKDQFTLHRDDEGTHSRWKSLSLYGLSENKHDSWQDYGYANAVEAAKDFVWTPASKQCPVTMDFLQNIFPCKRFSRVRFMLVEAGGWIGSHIDTKYRILENINISLSNPTECVWKWDDGESLFMEPGSAYTMNISYGHSIINNSTEDRYHLIVSRQDSLPEWQALIDQAATKAGVVGHYELHEVAV